MAARQHRPDRPSPFPLLSRHRPPAAAVALPVFKRERSQAPRTVRHHGYRGAAVFAILMAALAALAWGSSGEALGRAGEALGWLIEHDTPRGRALVAILALGAGALSLVGAWARETAERRPVRLAGGRARMAVDEVAATLRAALLEEAGLADADVQVRNLHHRGVRVAVRADIRPQARIDETVAAVDELVTEIVEHYMGVRLAARPAVDVRYRELDLRLGRGT